jgi:hypothetical protein
LCDSESRHENTPGQQGVIIGPLPRSGEEQMLATKATVIALERKPHWFQFSLRTLMLVITLAAVCLGLIRTTTAIGIVLAAVAAAALVRTCRAVARSRAGDHPVSLRRAMGTFLNSVVIVVAMTAAWLGTLLVACFVGSLLAVIVVGSVYIARISAGATWLWKRGMLATARCRRVNGYLFQRFWSR